MRAKDSKTDVSSVRPSSEWNQEIVAKGASLLPLYIKSTFRNYSLVHSDEGLELETTVFESFYGG